MLRACVAHGDVTTMEVIQVGIFDDEGTDSA